MGSKLSSIVFSPNKYCQNTTASETKIKYQMGLIYSAKILPKILILNATKKEKIRSMITTIEVKTKSPRLSRLGILGKISSLNPDCANLEGEAGQATS